MSHRNGKAELLVPLARPEAPRPLTLNEILERRAFLRGRTDDLDPPNRDLNTSCGYPAVVDTPRVKALVRRFGLAGRTNDVYEDEAWASPPAVYEDADPATSTPFEAALSNLVRRLALWTHLHHLARLAGYGRFGVLFLGFGDGLDPATPVNNLQDDGTAGPGRPRETPVPLSYVRVLDSEDVQVAEFEDNRRSPRYGQVRYYHLRFGVPSNPAAPVPAGDLGPAPFEWVKVHWSRVLHYADGPPGTLEHGIRLEPVFDALLDCRKILGGSAEMFWKGGFPGLALTTHPTIPNPKIDKASLRAELDEYHNDLKRWLALEGFAVTPLNPNIADPASHLSQQLRVIAAGRQVPVPVLLGEQAGVLASQQNTKTWKSRVRGYREDQVTPALVRPLVDRLVLAGAVPAPAAGDYQVDWPDLDADTDADRAQVAVRMSQAVLQYVTGGGEKVMPVRYFLTLVLGVPDAVAAEVLAAAKAQAEADLLTKDLWKPKAGQQTSPTGRADARTGPAGSQNGTARR